MMKDSKTQKLDYRYKLNFSFRVVLYFTLDFLSGHLTYRQGVFLKFNAYITVFNVQKRKRKKR